MPAPVAPIANRDATAEEVGRTLHMDFENYTLGRLFDDRRNYDENHPGHQAAAAHVRGVVWSLGWRSATFEALDRAIAEDASRAEGRAGVIRDELLKPSPTRKAITWHDARATGITWQAVEGVDATRIQRRAGHTTIETTMGYIREAESFAGEAFGAPFPPLPPPLLGADPSASGAAGSADDVDGFGGRGGRDSNPSEEPGKQPVSLGGASDAGANGRESRPFASGSWPFATMPDLQAAIANITRASGTASHDAILALVKERAAMRAELVALESSACENGVSFNRRR